MNLRVLLPVVVFLICLSLYFLTPHLPGFGYDLAFGASAVIMSAFYTIVTGNSFLFRRRPPALLLVCATIAAAIGVYVLNLSLTNLKTMPVLENNAYFVEKADQVQIIKSTEDKRGNDKIVEIYPKRFWLVKTFFINILLLVIALSLGTCVGIGVEKASHTLVIICIGAVADLWSVSVGVTEKITASPHISYYFLLNWPIIGQGGITYPLIGVTDFLFVAIFLTVMRKFNWPLTRNVLGMFVAVAFSVASALVMRVGIPVLPFIGASVLLLNFKVIRLSRNERPNRGFAYQAKPSLDHQALAALRGLTSAKNVLREKENNVEARNLLKFFSDHPFLGLLGSLSSIVGLILAIIFYFQGKEYRDLTYRVHPLRTVIAQGEKTDRLKIYFMDKLITGIDIVITRISLRNLGNISIKYTNILSPLEIFFTPPVRILDSSIDNITRDITGFKISHNEEKFENGRIPISWKILEEYDGADIQIIYAGKRNSKLGVSGIIESQGNARDISENMNLMSPTEQYNYIKLHNYMIRIIGILFVILLWLLLCVDYRNINRSSDDFTKRLRTFKWLSIIGAISTILFILKIIFNVWVSRVST